MDVRIARPATIRRSPALRVLPARPGASALEDDADDGDRGVVRRGALEEGLGVGDRLRRVAELEASLGADVIGLVHARFEREHAVGVLDRAGEVLEIAARDGAV